uniref:Uncharacterized protein n=1 Tax=candidate division CPR3 bacterium TaxID=2268181 RepID=A0A7C5YUK0_UNCC3
MISTWSIAGRLAQTADVVVQRRLFNRCRLFVLFEINNKSIRGAREIVENGITICMIFFDMSLRMVLGFN